MDILHFSILAKISGEISKFSSLNSLSVLIVLSTFSSKFLLSCLIFKIFFHFIQNVARKSALNTERSQDDLILSMITYYDHPSSKQFLIRKQGISRVMVSRLIQRFPDNLLPSQQKLYVNPLKTDQTCICVRLYLIGKLTGRYQGYFFPSRLLFLKLYLFTSIYKYSLEQMHLLFHQQLNVPC